MWAVFNFVAWGVGCLVLASVAIVAVFAAFDWARSVSSSLDCLARTTQVTSRRVARILEEVGMRDPGCGDPGCDECN